MRRSSLRKTEGRGGQAEKRDVAFLTGDLQPPSRARYRPHLTEDPWKCPIKGLTELPLEKVPWHQVTQGRGEGQTEGGQYPGGHGAKAVAHVHKDDEK